MDRVGRVTSMEDRRTTNSVQAGLHASEQAREDIRRNLRQKRNDSIEAEQRYASRISGGSTLRLVFACPTTIQHTA